MALKPRSAPRPAAEIRADDTIYFSKLNLSWRPIVGAVLDVCRENKKIQKLSGLRANDVEALLVDDFRADLFNRVRMAWARRTSQAWDWFPCSTDFVALVYKRAAQMSPAARNELFASLTEKDGA